MKTSKEIIGLPVFSIAEVLKLGEVKDLLINPENGAVDYIVVAPLNTIKENGLIPFANVVGIGEDALTVRTEDKMIPFSTDENALMLLDKNVRVIGTKVMTEKGTITGIISELLIDDENGKIVGCQWVPNGEESASGYIPSQHVITFGRDLIIVDKDFKQYVTETILPEDNTFKPEPEQPAQPKISDEPESAKSDPLEFFADKQNEFLIGRKVTADIITDGGEVIAKEGSIVTPEIIEQAIANDKYIDLTLNNVEKEV
ncbi:PRC-barrel domain-containing protein [Peptococcaceae bacterium 1198_IL3148]